MSIAKIIAPVTGAKRDAVVLATALAAAKPFNAHVEVLFIYPDPWLAMPDTGMPLSPVIAQSLIDEATALAEKSRKRAHSTLHQEAEKAGAKVLPKPVRTPELSCSFREAQGYLPHLVADAAQLADLIVFGPLSPLDGTDINDAFMDTLTKTDRPVLIAEHAPTRMICNVSIAWDEAAPPRMR